MNMSIYVLWLKIIFFFDVIALTVTLIQLLTSGWSVKKSIGQFVGLVVSEALLLNIFMGVPFGCSVKILYKTPIGSTYYVADKIIEDPQIPKTVRLTLRPVRFVVSTLLSDKEESRIKDLRARNVDLVDIIDNQITFYLVNCFHLKNVEYKNGG